MPCLIFCLPVLCREEKEAKGSEPFQETPILPYFALTLTAFLFGLSFVATKYALEYIPPFTLIFLRFSIAFPVLAIFYRLTPHNKINSEDRWRMALTALIVPGAYFLAETYGLKFSSASSISLLVATIPIFTALFAFLFLHEKIAPAQILGILLSMIGVGVILGTNPTEMARESVMRIGHFLGLGAALCAGLYMVLARNLMKQYAPLALTLLQSLFAVLVFLPLAVWEQGGGPWKHLPFGAIGAVFYLAIFCSVLAFFLWNYGISRLEASRAAVFTNLVPVFTVLGATLLLGERIHLRQIMGGALVIAGVMLASRRRGKG
jgi:drug/metabolite transporter (DMT)-like permease